MKLLIKQALLVPIYFFAPVLTAGILTGDYSAISQHASEITLTDNSTAIMILNSGAILSGSSCVLLSIGLMKLWKRKHLFSAILLMIFGASMISNGLYPMGNPMHGFYGIGLCLMIIPFVSCYEFKGSSVDKRYFPITITAGLVIFVYFWSMLVGLDPLEYRGLTQRIASIAIFGWIAYLAYEIIKTLPNNGYKA
ncbi:MAG: DUF998 domain-containing protein [Crocinitomicaceae bacterium]|nr:DUF998 domain-containing protein [Crocinitomicaceae bacterium]